MDMAFVANMNIILIYQGTRLTQEGVTARMITDECEQKYQFIAVNAVKKAHQGINEALNIQPIHNKTVAVNKCSRCTLNQQVLYVMKNFIWHSTTTLKEKDYQWLYEIMNVSEKQPLFKGKRIKEIKMVRVRDRTGNVSLLKVDRSCFKLTTGMFLILGDQFRQTTNAWYTSFWLEQDSDLWSREKIHNQYLNYTNCTNYQDTDFLIKRQLQRITYQQTKVKPWIRDIKHEDYNPKPMKTQDYLDQIGIFEGNLYYIRKGTICPKEFQLVTVAPQKTRSDNSKQQLEDAQYDYEELDTELTQLQFIPPKLDLDARTIQNNLGKLKELKTHIAALEQNISVHKKRGKLKDYIEAENTAIALALQMDTNPESINILERDLPMFREDRQKWIENKIIKLKQDIDKKRDESNMIKKEASWIKTKDKMKLND